MVRESRLQVIGTRWVVDDCGRLADRPPPSRLRLVSPRHEPMPLGPTPRLYSQTPRRVSLHHFLLLAYEVSVLLS